MANEIFNKMASALNSSFIEEDKVDNKKLVPVDTNLPATQDDKKEVSEEVFEEQSYLKESYHETIEGVSEVMETLKSDLRQGSKASLFEAYSNLAKTKLLATDSLKSFDKDIKHERRFEENDIENKNNNAPTNLTLNLNGADMLDKILEYRQKKIKTTEIIDEEND